MMELCYCIIYKSWICRSLFFLGYMGPGTVCVPVVWAGSLAYDMEGKASTSPLCFGFLLAGNDELGLGVGYVFQALEWKQFYDMVFWCRIVLISTFMSVRLLAIIFVYSFGCVCFCQCFPLLICTVLPVRAAAKA